MKHALSLIESESEEDANVNLTPLIDVVFVVLIMFILVAPLVEIDRIQLANGPSEKKPDSATFNDKSGLKIHVYKDNTIWLSGVPLSADELKTELTALRPLNQGVTPQIFHDKEAFFGTYQSVKNALEEAGFESVDVILGPGS